MKKGSAKGISRAILVVIVVIVILIIAGGAYLATRSSVSTTISSITTSSSQIGLTSSSTTSSTSLASASSSFSSTSSSSSTSSTTTSISSSSFGPANKSILIDDSQTVTPEPLDPATSITSSGQFVFNNVFQQLVEFDGPNSSQNVVVPAIAQNYSVVNNENYTFNIRPGVTFSNGDPVNASIVWFSFVRNLYMAQAADLSYFVYVTENQSSLSATGLSVPWGLLNAVQNATGLPTTTNFTLALNVLNNMLSNFDASNSTIQKVMSYPDQAYYITGPMTFVASELHTYPYFLSDIAQSPSAIVDPVFIDANGGVQANTPNTYFDNNGGPGTGPYYIASVASGFSTIVLKASPNYWAINSTGYPVVCDPPHIPVVVINFGLSANQRLEDFATNGAQISFVDFPLLGQLWSAYKYKQYATFNQIFDDVGPALTTQFVSMNVAQYPTNNTDFRLAVVHAVNYTQLLDETYTFNGTVYAIGNYLGPLTPSWGKYYNPDNLTMYSFNTTLAINYMNLAGQQEHFSLTLPNGTVIGDTSAPALGPLTLVYIAPLTPEEQTENEVIQSGLNQIGLSVAVQGVTSGEFYTYITPQTTPTFVNSGGWGPTWPDPVLGEMFDILTPVILETYMNLTQVNQLISSLVYQTNQTTYMQGIAELYNLTYNYVPYLWLPTYDNYFLVQPYLHGVVYSPYFTPTGMYWYNLMYYS